MPLLDLDSPYLKPTWAARLLFHLQVLCVAICLATFILFIVIPFSQFLVAPALRLVVLVPPLWLSGARFFTAFWDYLTIIFHIVLEARAILYLLFDICLFCLSQVAVKIDDIYKYESERVESSFWGEIKSFLQYIGSLVFFFFLFLSWCFYYLS